MNLQHLSFRETRTAFSSLFLDYIEQQPKTHVLYQQYPSFEGFEKQLAAKKFSSKKRKALVQVLEQQYQGLPSPPDFATLLQENTFVVTTGHQLNIFTGPLYVIYKIITTIRLAETLTKAFPDYNFIPVYWLASEDHDFAEINHFNLFGKTYTWQTSQTGAVGRMNPQELEYILAEIPGKLPIFEKAYTQNFTLVNAVRQYMHQLFGSRGLICLDADDAVLKRLFSSVIKQELLEQPSNALVQEQSKKIEDLGYKTPLSPREINLFYLDTGLRERIVQEGEKYRVLHTNMLFSETEILSLLESNPERFSPNVVLRPVYQETILPNLAYIGGPSELPYWLQLRSLVEYFDEPFPILIPRNFATIVNTASQKRMAKLGLIPHDLFWDEVSLRKNFVERNSHNTLELVAETQQVETLFATILEKALLIDKSLEGFVKAEQQKLLNAFQSIEKRLKKAEENNQITEIAQVLALKNKLFPMGMLQERHDNFLNFHLNNPDFLDQLFAHFNPFDFRMLVLME